MRAHADVRDPDVPDGAHELDIAEATPVFDSTGPLSCARRSRKAKVLRESIQGGERCDVTCKRCSFS